MRTFYNFSNLPSIANRLYPEHTLLARGLEKALKQQQFLDRHQHITFELEKLAKLRNNMLPPWLMTHQMFEKAGLPLMAGKISANLSKIELAMRSADAHGMIKSLGVVGDHSRISEKALAYSNSSWKQMAIGSANTWSGLAEISMASARSMHASSMATRNAQRIDAILTNHARGYWVSWQQAYANAGYVQDIISEATLHLEEDKEDFQIDKLIVQVWMALEKWFVTFPSTLIARIGIETIVFNIFMVILATGIAEGFNATRDGVDGQRHKELVDLIKESKHNCLSTLTPPRIEEFEKTYYVTMRETAVHKKPTSKSCITGYIIPQDIVELEERAGKWIKIVYLERGSRSFKPGWVTKKHLKMLSRYRAKNNSLSIWAPDSQ